MPLARSLPLAVCSGLRLALAVLRWVAHDATGSFAAVDSLHAAWPTFDALAASFPFCSGYDPRASLVLAWLFWNYFMSLCY